MANIIYKINNFLKLKIHKWLFTYEYLFALREGGKMPIRIYQNDAGYDLYVSENTVVRARSMINVPTGVSCLSKIPAWILLTGRSSTLLKHGLMVNDGVIDGDYTGELFIKVYNPNEKDVLVPKGMRIGQIIVLPHTNIKFNRVVSIQNRIKNARGDRGFGSSGT